MAIGSTFDLSGSGNFVASGYFRGTDNDDTYLFGMGDNHKTIIDSKRELIKVDGENLHDPNVIRTDTLIFKSGLQSDDIEYYRTGAGPFNPGYADGDLTFRIIETGDTVTLHNFFFSTESQVRTVQKIEFEDGGSLDVDVIFAELNTATVSYNEGNQRVSDGSEADENLHGYDRDDIINAGDGNDRVTAYDGDDSISGGGGKDHLYGSFGNDSIRGDGGDDVLRGGPGDDVLSGGIGDDVVYGGRGNDTYVFGRGDGHDIIREKGSYSSPGLYSEEELPPADKQDQLLFKSGLSVSDIEFYYPPGYYVDTTSITFRIIDTGETITVEDWFHKDANTYGYRLESIVFEDGGFVDISLLEEMVSAEPINLSQVSVDAWAIQGSKNVDNLEGTETNDVFFSGGLSSGVESIRSNGGSDRLVLDANDTHTINKADDTNGHFRIRDFVIGDVESDEQADVLDLGAFLLGLNLDASNIGSYLHVVSGVYGSERTGVFVDREGRFTNAKRQELDNDVERGGQGADLFLEFQGQTANNNFAQITGKADNTVEQFQALIDMGFLDISKANSEAVPVPIDTTERVDIFGTSEPDDLVGTGADENFFSGGLSGFSESIRGSGGSDKLILDADDAFAVDAGVGSLIRVRDFTIDNIAKNYEADILDLSDFLNASSELNASNVGNYLHIVSGTWDSRVTNVYIDKDGNFTDEMRDNIDANPLGSGRDVDLYLEFQNLSAGNNFEHITGENDNTIAQFQALMDMGFLALSSPDNGSAAGKNEIFGNNTTHEVLGSSDDDIIFPNDVDSIKHIYSNGGADTLVFHSDDVMANNDASDVKAHVRIKDFVIDDTSTNSNADVLSLADLLSSNNDVTTLSQHLHVISGLYGHNRTGVFIDKDGNFSDEDRTALDASPSVGGQGSDLFLEFQGQAGNNNFEDITGYADNSIEQIQSLIDMGFLDVA